MPLRTPDDEAVVSRLIEEFSRLNAGETLKIAEFATSCVTSWRVGLDECGTPRIRSESRSWDSLRRRGMLDETALTFFLQPDDNPLRVLVRSARAGSYSAEGDADRALDIAAGAYQRANAFHVQAPVGDLLDEAVGGLPLPSSIWYELVLLNRTRTGRLEFTAQQLFLPDAQQGETRIFTIRCEPSGENGTVFAVAARNQAFEFQLMSMQSAVVPAGTYTVTATLLRRGHVRFGGLPVELRDDARRWSDVTATVPERLEVAGSSHLIIAVEACGAAAELQDRVDRASQLLADVAAGAASAVRFSVLSYAAHVHERHAADEPVRVLCWAAADAGQPSRSLNRLREQSPARLGRSPAAAVECLLASVSELLREPGAASAGRPVLVVVGGRPAFPPRVDGVNGFLPCPWRRDWRLLFAGLSSARREMAFAAIRDGDDIDDDPFREDPFDDMWRMLGRDAYARAGAFNSRSFAVRVGLISPTVQYVPIPFAVPEGAE